MLCQTLQVYCYIGRRDFAAGVLGLGCEEGGHYTNKGDVEAIEKSASVATGEEREECRVEA